MTELEHGVQHGGTLDASDPVAQLVERLNDYVADCLEAAELDPVLRFSVVVNLIGRLVIVQPDPRGAWQELQTAVDHFIKANTQ